MKNNSPSKWIKYKLFNFCHINPTVKLETGKKYPFIAMESIEPETRFIGNLPLEEFDGSGTKFETQDTVFARITPCLENGKIAQFNLLNGEKGFGSTEFYVFRGKKDISDSNFLYYLLRTYEIRKHAENSMAGASGRQRADINYIKKVEFLAPLIGTQIRIAAILSTFDKLIKINKLKISILEEISQFLYREWFVEFRFPGYEKVKFVDSELGKIPEDWCISNIEDTGYFKKTPIGINKFGGEKLYYQTSEIEGSSINGEFKKVTYNDRPSRADVEPKINAVYMARMKDTDKLIYFRETNKKDAEEILLSTGMFGYQAKNEYFGYLYSTLNSYRFVQNKNLFATGSTQVSLNDEILKKIKLIFPNEELIKKYSLITNPLLDQILLLLQENKILTSIRDLLLPKLMSGEIDVSKLDIQIDN